jgi:hypothetical protein
MLTETEVGKYIGVGTFVGDVDEDTLENYENYR